MKKIWILFLMFLVSISSYAFTLTCLGNYYSRISQMNVNIYQDLHNNRDGDFYIVTYENEGREYVRMVLGIKDLERLVKELDELKIENESEYIKLEKFVFNMDKMYKACDMCITRAGAMTITELALAARPAILVPLPTATENHQYYNAKVLENARAGKII